MVRPSMVQSESKKVKETRKIGRSKKKKEEKMKMKMTMVDDPKEGKVFQR